MHRLERVVLAHGSTALRKLIFFTATARASRRPIAHHRTEAALAQRAKLAVVGLVRAHQSHEARRETVAAGRRHDLCHRHRRRGAGIVTERTRAGAPARVALRARTLEIFRGAARGTVGAPADGQGRRHAQQALGAEDARAVLEGVDGLLIVRLYVLFHALVVHLAGSATPCRERGSGGAVGTREERATRVQR